jgi:hypothetical protein
MLRGYMAKKIEVRFRQSSIIWPNADDGFMYTTHKNDATVSI